MYLFKILILSSLNRFYFSSSNANLQSGKLKSFKNMKIADSDKLDENIDQIFKEDKYK